MHDAGAALDNVAMIGIQNQCAQGRFGIRDGHNLSSAMIGIYRVHQFGDDSDFR